MKALSLWQPWASLVALGEKKIETREWATKHRGLLAIHATVKMPPFWLGSSRHSVYFQKEVADALSCNPGYIRPFAKTLPLGAVLCIVNLREIQETPHVREILCERERIFGNYNDGRYAWFLELVERFETPIPAKGNRMLWNWDESDRKRNS